MAKSLLEFYTRRDPNNQNTYGYGTQLILDGLYPIYANGICYTSSADTFKINKKIYKTIFVKNNFMQSREISIGGGSYYLEQTKSKITKINGTEYSNFFIYIPSGLYTHGCSANRYGKTYLLYIKLNELKSIIDSIVKESVLSKEDLINGERSIWNRTDIIPQIKNIPFVKEKIYTLLQKECDIPILREWVDFLLNTPSITFQLLKGYYADIDNEDNLYAFVVGIDIKGIKQEISGALSQGILNINGCHSISKIFEDKEITDLTSYLEHFSSHLIDKATQRFVPIFNPSTDKFTDKEKDYFDYADNVGKMKFFNTQMNVMAAVSRSLKKEKSSLIVGEMGTGKTAMAIGSTYLSSKKDNSTNIVMCPGHLVEKWKREVERLYPGAIAKIISDFDDLLNLDKRIRDKNRKYPLFLIISKDTAKISYVERPNIIYDKDRKTFKCPICGAEYYNSELVKHSPGALIDPASYESRFKTHKRCSSLKSYVKLKDISILEAFLNKNDKNSQCCTTDYLVPKKTNLSYFSMKQGRSYHAQYMTCGCHLWSATNSKEATKWKKYTGVGYIHDDMLPLVYDLYDKRDSLTSERKSFITKLFKAVKNAEELGENKRAPRRYSIARYIRKYYKGLIDFFIADEVHMYSSSTSAQANAFGDFVQIAKKTIALTGTLLNGYANGIYYILYRMYPKDFKKRGFNYDSVINFVNDYGVSQEIYKASYYPNGRRYGQKTTKICPGVSPELFTKFLLDKAIFVSLSDMSTGLPEYTETPVPVRMLPEVEEKYRGCIQAVRDYLQDTRNRSKSLSVAFPAAQKLNLYPDQPYNVAPICNPDNLSEKLINFPDAIPRENQENYHSTKDLKVLEIVNQKIQRGENVLIYLDYVNKTDCIERLEKIFKIAGIKACTLTSAIPAKKREEWIDTKVKEGYKVMICNPKLVETGLDLLSFTNIIFYQVGYNLFTMRQASRRSLRLNQPNNVNVYFMYYENTTQEVTLSLMANKLQAAMAIEGKFSEEGLTAMSNNDSILTRLANSLVNDIEYKIKEGDFQTSLTAEDDDGSRFKMVYILNNTKTKHFNSLFDKKLTEYKKKIKFDNQIISLAS